MPQLPLGRAAVPVAALAGTTLVGAPMGLVWAATAPRVNYLDAANGFFSAFAATSGIDAVFSLLSLGVGLAVGVLAAAVLPPRGAATPVAVALGGWLAALVASRVGALARAAGLHRVLRALAGAGVPPANLHLFAGTVAFQVRGSTALAVLPFAAMLGYGALSLLRRDRPEVAGVAEAGAGEQDRAGSLSPC